tara:strand:- start:18020 stop:18253 length:234 start_codon:yes stop_codon:yes gene_type:complete
MTQVIDERDSAESALSEAYALVMGHAPEWSNLFGYRDAINQIEWKLKRERDHETMVMACGDAIGGFDQSIDSTKEQE